MHICRRALAFGSYMITAGIQGDKVTLMGYQEAVYVHLPACNVLFHLKDCPAVFTRLAKDTVAKSGVSFIFEATFAANKLYLSDLLLLGEMEGAHMLVNERVDVMREKLGELKGGVVQLLPWYPVNAMERCVKENQEAGGILFINPDGVLLGEYDSRNYLYPLHRKKTVELRIWNGNFTGGKWTFEAYCTEAGSEKLVEGIHVHISDADVNAHCINDGNILECGLEDQHVGPSKGRKSSKHYVFKRRCMWTFKPTTMYKQEFFLSDPKWTKDRVGQACTTVTYIPAARPQVQDSASG
uniref:Uncharacterized protein TCIL3000_11_14880 n=1 Tax=Trypanosoma congolense (strain IL3000) TaxID=1068625 RepID=G0V2U8_TRYCI|nr:unnamed protein product [Trypanosoma congolense IL3000]